MKKHPFKISLLFGIPMLLLGVALLFLGVKANGNLPAGFVTPVVAFEFIQSQQEVTNFFNVPAPNLYRVDFMLVQNLDYFFMFLYASFLGLTGFAIKKETNMQVMWLAIILCLTMFFSDLFENIAMASIVQEHFNGGDLTSSYFGNLSFFTWLKWGSIAAVFFMYSGYFFKRNALGKIIGTLAVLNFIAAIVAFLNRSVFNEIMAGMVILLFVLTVIHNWRYKLQESEPLQTA